MYSFIFVAVICLAINQSLADDLETDIASPQSAFDIINGNVAKANYGCTTFGLIEVCSVSRCTHTGQYTTDGCNVCSCSNFNTQICDLKPCSVRPPTPPPTSNPPSSGPLPSPWQQGPCKIIQMSDKLYRLCEIRYPSWAKVKPIPYSDDQSVLY